MFQMSNMSTFNRIAFLDYYEILGSRYTNYGLEQTFGGQCNDGQRDEQNRGCQRHSPIEKRNKVTLETSYSGYVLHCCHFNSIPLSCQRPTYLTFHLSYL